LAIVVLEAKRVVIIEANVVIRPNLLKLGE